MQPVVMDFVARVITAEDVAGREILEVGAYNVNGSVREIIEPMVPARYVGTDMREGPGVDVACNASELVARFGAESFDGVVSTDTLEHVLDWRGAVKAMKACLRTGGWVLISVPSPGFPQHDYPDDFWRFSVADLGDIFADFTIDTIEPIPLGAVLKAHKPAKWEPLDLSNINVPEVSDANVGAPGGSFGGDPS